ncbi:MAG: glycosyltransferase [Chlamydiae bacterium]|nr:glycosyltransferase [Chlamydiota bacterium]
MKSAYLIRVFLCFLFPIGNCVANAYPSQKKVGIITSSNMYGDLEVAYRMKIAGERLGWIVVLDETNGEGLRNIPLDFAIVTTGFEKVRFRSIDYPYYLVVYQKVPFFDDHGFLHDEYADYNGYLLTIKKDGLFGFDPDKMHPILPNIFFYPTAYSTPYQPVTLCHLAYIIPSWGNRAISRRFRDLYDRLSRDRFSRFYGSGRFGGLYGKQYIGTLPFNGQAIIEMYQSNGIALVLHSDMHLAEEIPSGRVFEAAAASAVIISDRNPFIEKYFGDSVFYINTSLSGAGMFAEIQSHIQTILNNPKKALKMARKAHQIFLEKFAMESQLLKLEEMHEQILQNNPLGSSDSIRGAHAKKNGCGLFYSCSFSE